MNYNFKNLADFIEAGNLLIGGDIVQRITGGRGSTVTLHLMSHTKFWNENTDVHHTHTIVSLVPREIKVTEKQFKNLSVFLDSNTLQHGDVIEDSNGTVRTIGSQGTELLVWSAKDGRDSLRKILSLSPRMETKQPVVGPTFEPFKARIVDPECTFSNYYAVFKMFPEYYFTDGGLPNKHAIGMVVATVPHPDDGRTLYIFVSFDVAYVVTGDAFKRDKRKVFEPYKVRIIQPGHTCTNYREIFEQFPEYTFVYGDTTTKQMVGGIMAHTTGKHSIQPLFIFVCEGQAYVLHHGAFEIVPVTEPVKRQGNPKYDVTIIGKYGSGSCVVDVYSVLDAFKVTIPQLQHSIKKELKVGGRGHKDIRQDLVDIRDSTKSALDAFDAKAKVEASNGKCK